MEFSSKEYLRRLLAEEYEVPTNRESLLTEIADYVKSTTRNDKPSKLIFICTHNSRRSIMAQLWARVAADYYGVPHVETYSGGTETTAFNPNAVEAVRRAGFTISQEKSGTNPIYQLTFDETGSMARVWSKVYDNDANPDKDFAAIMTCSSANESCPVVLGSDLRVPLTYEDPKISDDTPNETRIYDERCEEIAREMFYCFRKASK